MKTRKMLKGVAMAVALSGVAACDYAERAERAHERAASGYRAAMADYEAGRLPAAVKGFVSVCSEDPGNASARFQLACLLQDVEKDYLGAFCAYREYLLQEPESDKAALARSRLATCEREMARTLADKYELNARDRANEEIAALRQTLKTAETRSEKRLKELGESSRRVAALEDEVRRLKELLKAEAGLPRPGEEADETPAADRDAIAEAKRLLEESDDPAAAPESTDDAKRLLAEAAGEDDALPLVQAPDAKEKRAAAELAAKAEAERKAREQSEKAARHEPRPAHYVVQRDDTLYKIALRFYGRTSAWKLIREANKATISTDGRVRAGQRLVLPDVE